jgi:hypothetical protein
MSKEAFFRNPFAGAVVGLPIVWLIWAFVLMYPVKSRIDFVISQAWFVSWTSFVIIGFFVWRRKRCQKKTSR